MSKRKYSIGHVVTNWQEYDAPVGKKLRLFAKNELRKAARLKTCCGHHGEPGC
ncbi:MAG: hypothetical protein ABR552_02210 [Actinomycetota bacterium]